MAAPVSMTHVLDEHDRIPLDKAVQRADERGLEARTKLLTGNPAKEIVGYADSIDADLIVVGSHWHAPSRARLLGSVSRGVLRRTQCPVLIVREVPQLVEAAV